MQKFTKLAEVWVYLKNKLPSAQITMIQKNMYFDIIIPKVMITLKVAYMKNEDLVFQCKYDNGLIKLLNKNISLVTIIHNSNDIYNNILKYCGINESIINIADSRRYPNQTTISFICNAVTDYQVMDIFNECEFDYSLHFNDGIYYVTIDSKYTKQTKEIINNILNMKTSVNESGEYREFFEKKLSDYGVSSPAELSQEEKAKFFSEIKSEWKQQKINESGEYREFFEKKLSDYGVSSPAELSQEEKAKFFSEIKSEWKQQKVNESAIQSTAKIFTSLGEIGLLSNDAIEIALSNLGDVMSKLSTDPSEDSIKAYKDAEDKFNELTLELENRNN